MMMVRVAPIAGLLLLVTAAGWAQQPKPDGMSLTEAAARRFPQPVNVASLIGRTVLRPLESQPVLGHVSRIVRTADGVKVVVDYGGLLGFGTRPIAVPVEAMTLLGQNMEIVDFTPQQLDGFPAFDPSGTTPIGGDEVIRVGLARPSH